MKFTTNRDVILSALKGIKPAIPTKSNIPVLMMAYMKATKDNELILRGSDLDLSIEKNVAVDVQEPGEICVPFKLLFDLMSNLPSIPVNLFLDGGKMVVIAEKNKYSLGTESVDNYPEFFNEIEPAESFDMSVKMIQKVLNNTAFATSSDDLRAVLKGIYLTTEDNCPVWVSTDGHRLSKFVIEGANLILNEGVVFPLEFLNSFMNIDSEMISIKLFQNHIVAVAIGGGTQIISRKIDGKFPNYNAVIPGDLTDSIYFNRLEMLQALKRVLIFANSISKQVILTINKDFIQVESMDEGSSGTENIPCESMLENFVMGFNGSYLVDILSTSQNEKILLMVINPKKACIFYDGEEAGKSFFLQMPVRLGDD